MEQLGAWFLLYGATVAGLAVLDVLVGTAFWIVRSRLDRAHPDDLPLTAGKFAEQTAQRLGLGVSVLAAVSEKQGTDVFWMSGRAVVLTTHTFVKRDPTCWAIAAHELGHALNHGRGALVALTMEGARALSSVGRLVGTGALLGNLAFASRDLSVLAVAALSVGLLGHAVVLVDELSASAVGMRLLREDGRLDEPRLRVALQVLGAAFATYVVAMVGQLLLLLVGLELDAQALERQFSAAAPLAGAGAVAASALAVLVLVVSVASVWSELRPVPPPRSLEEAQGRERLRDRLDLARGAVILLLVAWIWDQPLGPGVPVACVLAAISARAALALVLAPVLTCLALPLLLVFAPLLVGVGVLQAMYGEAEQVPGHEAARTRAAVDAASDFVGVALAAARSPTLLSRLGRLLDLCAPLPLAALVLAYG
jgi:Zn-dependent membrane protease YugP